MSSGAPGPATRRPRMMISRRARRILQPRRILRPRRARLRTRVLAGVMAVTVAALAAFDNAAVTQMHRYLISRADAQLRNILNLLEPLSQPVVTKQAGPEQRA